MLEDRRDGGGGVSEATTVRRYDFPGCGLTGEDAETAAAAARLRSGRLCYRALKRAFDVAFSLAVLVALSWLFLVRTVVGRVAGPERG